MTVAFDCDGTLVTENPMEPIEPIVSNVLLYLMFQKKGAEMYIWSHQGEEHATQVKAMLGLEGTVISKEGSFIPDIAVDNAEDNLGRVTMRV